MDTRRLLLAASLAVAIWAPSTAPAVADAGRVNGLQSGYWWEGEASSNQTPSPPQVPAGGLWVSSNSSGPQAISAIRFALAADTSSPVVTLHIAQAQPSGQLSIVACRATSDWSPPDGAGEWSSRPSADCSRGQAVAQIDPAGTTATLDLSSLVSAGGQVSVVLMPSSTTDPTNGSAPIQAPAPVYATFDASFNPLTEADVATTVSPASSGTGSAGDFSGLNGLGPDVTVPFNAPIATLLNPAPTAGAPPSLATPGVAATAAGPATPALPGQPQAAVSATHVRSWRQRVLLTLIFVDVVAYMLWTGSVPGAGRFARLSIYETPGRMAHRQARPGTPPPLR